MLAKLFQRLTADPAAEMALFDWVTRTARRPDWYVRGKIPDTIDGRFAMLATIAALAFVRLDQLEDPGERASVALTDRFAQVMESEHRELGIGDPTLGKTVLKLVGALGRRVDLWRLVEDGALDRASAVRASLPETADAEAIAFRSARLEAVADSLKAADMVQLAAGEIQ